jgi:hypothetical protein
MRGELSQGDGCSSSYSYSKSHLDNKLLLLGLSGGGRR